MDSELWALVPEIYRARDARLYDRKGRRYLDLWRNGGRALLGHRPDQIYRELKNVLQKGLVAEYPSLYAHRLEKALRALIPGDWEVRVFQNLQRARAEIKERLEEPFFSYSNPHSPPVSALYYRPFIQADYYRSPVVLPVLPFPGAFAPQPVLIQKGCREETFSSEFLEVSSRDPVSPFLMAALTRTVWFLIKIQKERFSWEDWNLIGWKRIACYGIPIFKLEEYPRVFCEFLSAGILIPPDPEDPLVLPMEWSPGEKEWVEKTAQRVIGKGGSNGNG
ncbi:MAG TPA: hypothetical protein PLG79_02955 [Spirochaetales bacterium]|nr:hypothetical protein [Spirochaetales bacterium]HOV37656.1 hypothetical protein [Spirochaetales bacterium]